MHHWYVYYKVAADALDQTVAEVRRMQQGVADASGVTGRLVARDGTDGTTLMEIYENIERPDAFDTALQRALSQSPLLAELRAARRTERFEDL